MEVRLAVLLIVHVSLLFAPRVVNAFRRNRRERPPPHPRRAARGPLTIQFVLDGIAQSLAL